MKGHNRCVVLFMKLVITSNATARMETSSDLTKGQFLCHLAGVLAHQTYTVVALLRLP